MSVSSPAAPTFEVPLSTHWPQLLPDFLRSEVPAAERSAYRLSPWINLMEQASPDWQARMHKAAFSTRTPVCWVKHPVWGYMEPYWPDPEVLKLLKLLASGHLQPEQLTPETFDLLVAASLLVFKDLGVYAQMRQQRDQQARQQFAEQRFCILPGLMSRLQIAAWRHYLRARYQQGQLQLEDSKYTLRKYRYGEPAAVMFHQFLPALLNPLLSEKIAPSYNLISYYEDGCELKSHTDRSSCIWNITLQVDSEPETSLEERWPLFIELPDQVINIYLNPGDAIVYPGQELGHGRPPLGPGRRETVMLFHFVDENFEGDRG